MILLTITIGVHYNYICVYNNWYLRKQSFSKKILLKGIQCRVLPNVNCK